MRPALALITVIAVGACGSSEAEVRSEFRRFVATNGACATSAECTLVSPGCPLGCWVAVRADRVDATAAKARALISEYEQGGRACAYGCVAGRTAACVAGTCAVVEVDAGSDVGH